MTATLIAKSAGLDIHAVNNWLDASAALAFQPIETNRLWEQAAAKKLGYCPCGKPATHLFADEESSDWGCRVPGCDVSFTRCQQKPVSRYEIMFCGKWETVTRCVRHGVPEGHYRQSWSMLA